jgi:hypothetical protein
MQVAGLEQWWNVNVQVCCSAAKYKMQAANAVQAWCHVSWHTVLICTMFSGLPCGMVQHFMTLW